MTDNPQSRERPPLVVKGELRYFGASVCKSFMECPRKWWFENVRDNGQRENMPFHSLGTSVHSLVEKRLKTGYWDPSTELQKKALKIAMAGEEFLPADKDIVRVNGIRAVEIDLHNSKLFSDQYTLDGIPLRGTIDLLSWNGATLSVDDHKTTKDFKWCKKPEELEKDFQLTLYAWVVRRNGLINYTDSIRVRHIYYLTQGKPESREVTAMIGAAEFSIITQVLPRLVDGMRTVAAKIRQEDAGVPKDRKPCFAYGGCKYAPECTAFRERKPEQGTLSNLRFNLRKPSEAPVNNPPIPKDTTMETSKKLFLYVGCRPSAGPHANSGIDLNIYLAPIVEKICEENGVEDLLLVPYGQGIAKLTAHLKANVPEGVFYCSRGRYTMAAIGAWAQHLTALVEGYSG